MVKTIGQVEGDGFVVSPDIRIDNDSGLLGEIKQFALSISGALTKSQLQSRGWAICDGTTPASQGISDATITTTPDLREKFLRHSADETTGGTGGSDEHTHLWYYNAGSAGGNHAIQVLTVDSNEGRTGGSTGDLINLPYSNDNKLNTSYTVKEDSKPPYYDICYFIKVK